MDFRRHVIDDVSIGSITHEIGLGKGDKLISINGEQVIDLIDYMEFMALEYLEVLIERKNGEELILEIEKDAYEDIGLIFRPWLMDENRRCRNKCIFCFVDQLPPNMRSTLYFKDDDWRLSFLMGNYITLTNLSDQDVDRIVSMGISPLYVSIHTTNPQLRRSMMNNKRAGEVLKYLDIFHKGGIKLNCQLVLCPGWNDALELDRTLSDLWQYRDIIESIALVPVGLTKYRKGLENIESFDSKSANNVLSQLDIWQYRALENLGRRFIYASDEFYILAGSDFPSYEDYDGFPQLDNGVGLIVKFQDELYNTLDNMPSLDGVKGHISLATGISAANFMLKWARAIEDKSGIKIDVYPIKNDFFGHSVTVAGLITGVDIVKNLKGKDLGDALLLPDVMLRRGEDVFLDDMLLIELKDKLGVEIISVPVDGNALVEAIIDIYGMRMG